MSLKIMAGIVFVGCCFSYVALGNDVAKTETTKPIDVTLRFDAKIDPVLNRANLVAIKQFILKQGNKATYCSMYGDNPAFFVKNHSFYLIPDPGPNGHPQYNINCDPQKTDFQTLHIANKDWGRDPYQYVDFKNEHYICVTVHYPADDLNIENIRDRTDEALKIILEEMKKP